MSFSVELYKSGRAGVEEIIVTKNEDILIREELSFNYFTKIVRGDIIIYYN
jgi:hypothetical protein